jgi:hypothetical protein
MKFKLVFIILFSFICSKGVWAQQAVTIQNNSDREVEIYHAKKIYGSQALEDELIGTLSPEESEDFYIKSESKGPLLNAFKIGVDKNGEKVRIPIPSKRFPLDESGYAFGSWVINK